MSLDTALRKVAQTVVGKFGTTAALRRVTGTQYSTATGTMAPVTTDTTVKGRVDEYTDRQLSNTVHVGDRKFTIAAADLPFTPTVDDNILLSGVVYKILRVNPEIATDDAAIHVLQLRR